MQIANSEIEATPASIAYRELVYAESARVAGFLFLLVGDPTQAKTLAHDAFRREWEAYRRGDIIGDAEEQLYRTATRAGLQWMQKTGNQRGFLPPTTSPDAVVVAMGIVSGFTPQQRSALLLVAWAGQSYRLAGLASGVGEARARDLTFAARQEYRVARAQPALQTPRCGEISSLLSASIDEEISSSDRARIDEHLTECETCRETADLYREFEATLHTIRIAVDEDAVRDAALEVPEASRRSRAGWLGRIGRLMSGPAFLVLSLVVVVFFFHDCGGPTIKTGAGRTSDVAFARVGSSLVAMESGSGREIGRVAAGALSPDGERVYSTRDGCRGDQSASTVSRSETATLKTDDLGCVPGHLAPIAVDESAGTLYLKDVEGRKLIAVDLSNLAVRGSMEIPPEVDLSDPESIVAAPDRSALFTLGASNEGPVSSAVVTRINPSLQPAGSVRFPTPNVALNQVIPLSADRVLVYDGESGRLREVNPATGQLLSATDLPGHQLPITPPAPGVRHHAVAISSDQQTLFVAVPDGGIIALDFIRGQVFRRMSANAHYVAIALSSDGGMLYTIDSTGAYVVLDATNGNELLRRNSTGLTDLVRVNPGQ